MATKKEAIVGLREARKFTRDLQEDSKQLTKSLLSLAARAHEGMKRGVPEAMDMTAREWMRYTFKESVAKIYRSMKIYKDLKQLPPSEVVEIAENSEGNAYDLARLPESLRSEKKWVKDAKELPNKEFHEKVVKTLTDRSITPDEPEEWIRFKWPVTVIESAHEMERRVARALGIDIEASPGNIRNVWEQVIQHINSLEDSDIRVNLGAGGLEAAS